MISYDNGQTWQDTGNERKGNLYEYESEDCASPTVIYRWINMDISTDWICAGTTKYYKQKKQVSYDNGQTWQDVSPAEYQRGAVYETESTDCGYVPPTPTVVYRWVNMDISTDYICVNTTKYYKQKKQVSYDEGQTWQDVTPAEYQRGDVYEEDSPDCKNYDDFSGQCLTFVANEDTRMMVNPNYGWSGQIYLSYDNGNTWEYTDSSYVPLRKGQKVMIKGIAKYGEALIEITGNCTVMGNPLSFYNYETFEHYLNGDYWNLYMSDHTSFANGLFSGCTGLTNIDYLYLPTFYYNEEISGQLHSDGVPDYAYGGMFKGCTNLTRVPKGLLHGNKLGECCYASMFYGCTSLTSAPDLPALALACGCYYSMFYGCTSLTTAPDLPALTLPTDGCSAALQTYALLFYGCTSLNHIKCLATNPDAYIRTDDWVSNVSPTGTFIKSAGVNWPTGDDGIPEGWTVIDA